MNNDKHTYTAEYLLESPDDTEEEREEKLEMIKALNKY